MMYFGTLCAILDIFFRMFAMPGKINLTLYLANLGGVNPALFISQFLDDKNFCNFRGFYRDGWFAPYERT